ncbi:MAG: glycosyltransferase, partial [Cyanobacteria bacterium P01_A01_bin.135]
MITVILGTSPYPFCRAIEWLSTLLNNGKIEEPIFVQSGVTDVSTISENSLVQTDSIISSDRLIDIVRDSRFVISHAGQGSTRMLVSQGASFVLIPRLAQFKEHIDDHQLSFAKATHQLG